MLITEFFTKAAGETIFELENGLYYLSPFWEEYLRDSSLSCEDVSDVDLTHEKLLEMLKLEVKRLNSKNDIGPKIKNWLWELLSIKVDGVMTEEENELAQKIIDNIGATIKQHKNN